MFVDNMFELTCEIMEEVRILRVLALLWRRTKWKMGWDTVQKVKLVLQTHSSQSGFLQMISSQENIYCNVYPLKMSSMTGITQNLLVVASFLLVASLLWHLHRNSNWHPCFLSLPDARKLKINILSTKPETGWSLNPIPISFWTQEVINLSNKT
jgi:hypothetical protein